jgi:hypothetical protein
METTFALDLVTSLRNMPQNVYDNREEIRLPMIHPQCATQITFPVALASGNEVTYSAYSEDLSGSF